MEDRHVRHVLENAPLASLGEIELAEVRAHAEACADCRRAFEAARVSSLLLRERAAAAVEPPAFFQTRVLAALRERRGGEEVWSFARLWKTAGALVASMAAAVGLLAGLTFVAPGAQTTADDDQLAAASGFYTTDDSLFAGDDTAADVLSDGQVLTTIYDQQDDEAK
jgi:hypothetical protein